MQLKKIYPADRAIPTGHYSPAVLHNGLIYVSGQLPLNEEGEPQLESIEQQTIQCMKNIENILAAGGSDLQNIIKVTVFIADIGNWQKFNMTFAKIMGDHRPARMVIPCNPLNRGCGIEMDCIAAVNEK